MPSLRQGPERISGTELVLSIHDPSILLTCTRFYSLKSVSSPGSDFDALLTYFLSQLELELDQIPCYYPHGRFGYQVSIWPSLANYHIMKIPPMLEPTYSTVIKGTMAGEKEVHFRTRKPHYVTHIVWPWITGYISRHPREAIWRFCRWASRV